MNSKGNLFGGKMLAWVASIFAIQNVNNELLVTAGMYNAQFLKPVKLGDLLSFDYKVAHIGKASITIASTVYSKKYRSICFFGLVTFCSVDDNGKPCAIQHEHCIKTLKKEPIWDYVENFRKLSKGMK
jgi:acyl-CoA hydrolase